jgi:hypothetical protein
VKEDEEDGETQKTGVQTLLDDTLNDQELVDSACKR